MCIAQHFKIMNMTTFTYSKECERIIFELNNELNAQYEELHWLNNVIIAVYIAQAILLCMILMLVIIVRYDIWIPIPCGKPNREVTNSRPFTIAPNLFDTPVIPNYILEGYPTSWKVNHTQIAPHYDTIKSRHSSFATNV